MNPLVLTSLTKHITDHAGIFSPEQVESLSRLFADHENRTTEQVLTVFIPHRQGQELLDIGLKLFNENGIGQQGLNNGLLLIVSTEEKKIRIITGKGMEIKYSEMVCREIIEKHLRPLLNEGKYEEMVRKWGEMVRGNMPILSLSYFATVKRNIGIYKKKHPLLTLGGLITFFVALAAINGELYSILILGLFFGYIVLGWLILIAIFLIGGNLLVKHWKLMLIVVLLLLISITLTTTIASYGLTYIKDFFWFTLFVLLVIWMGIEGLYLFRYELKKLCNKAQDTSFLKNIGPFLGKDTTTVWALLLRENSYHYTMSSILLVGSISLLGIAYSIIFDSSREYYCDEPKNIYCSEYLKEKEEAKIYRTNHPEEFKPSTNSSSQNHSSSSSSHSSWGGGGGSSNGGGYGD